MKTIVLLLLVSVSLCNNIWSEIESAEGVDELPINRIMYKDSNLIKICEILRPLMIGTTYMEDADLDSCEEISHRISGRDYVVL